MTVNIDWVLWLFAAICFGIGALFGGSTRQDGSPTVISRVNLMLLGFMFIAITFLV